MDDSAKEKRFFEPEQLLRQLQEGSDVVVIDVRSPEEFAAGHVTGAVNIPADQLDARASEIPKDGTIVTVCNFGGPRSCGAADQLRTMGYENATPLRGGMGAWQAKEE